MPRTSQLAAIMFTDIVGYTALMNESEEKAYQLLKKNRLIQKPLIEKHGGIWLKEMGDGVLASFQSVVSAVNCAIEIQNVCRNEPDLRVKIGINQGEVIVENGDVFGDGVNIASRLESVAPPSGIYISESVFRNVENKEGIKAFFVSEEKLKNVKYPVKIYEVNIDESNISQSNSQASAILSGNKKKDSGFKKIAFISLTIVFLVIISFIVYQRTVSSSKKISNAGNELREPTLAVLPFDDLSTEGNQEWLSNGVMEAINNNLLNIEGLRVIARATTMQFKDSEKSLSDIADALNVSHFLKGSVMRNETNIKINVQLIDAKDQKQIWSNSFNQELNTVFEIYDDVAFSVARKLNFNTDPGFIHVHPAEITKNMEAYESYLQAKASIEWGAESGEVRKSLEKAIALDSTFIAPYVWLGLYWMSQASWNATDEVEAIKSVSNALEYLQYAISKSDDYGDAYVLMGEIKFLINYNVKEARDLIVKGFRLNPNTSNKLNLSNMILPAFGEHDFSYVLAREAIQESPYDPASWAAMGMAEYFLGDHIKSKETFESGMSRFSDGNLINTAARMYFGMGDYKRIIEILEQFLSANPELRPARSIGYLAAAYNKLGNKERFNELLVELEQQAKSSPLGSPGFHLAIIFAQMGNINKAFEWLEKSYAAHEVELFWLKAEPSLEPIRLDPRYSQLLEKIGFLNK